MIKTPGLLRVLTKCATALLLAAFGVFAAGARPGRLTGRPVMLWGDGPKSGHHPWRGPAAATVIAHLRRYAPSRLGQLPGVTDEDDRAALQSRVQGTTPVPCSTRSTAGSPRALIPWASRRPRRC